MPTLKTDGTTYRINFESLLLGSTGYLTTSFYSNNAPRAFATAPYSIAYSDGSSGFSNSRLTLRTQLSGSADPCPGVGSCALGSSATVTTSKVDRERAGFSCGYYDHYVPSFQPIPPQGSLPPVSNLSVTASRNADCSGYETRISFALPSAAKRVHIYRDGHEAFDEDPATSTFVYCFGGNCTAFERDRLLPSTSYSYQVIYDDATGAKSSLTTARTTTPASCTPTRSADGVYRVALVLLYYTDYLVQNPCRLARPTPHCSSAATPRPARHAASTPSFARCRRSTAAKASVVTHSLPTPTDFGVSSNVVAPRRSLTNRA